MKTKILPDALATLKKDIVLTASLLLAIGSCLLVRPRVGYINFKVLVCLFDLMIVVKAFEELKLLDKFAVNILNKCSDSRMVSLILVLLSFFMSMLVTNDVALITLVPLALIISRKSNISMLTTVILQTLAANLGSSLTPMGNPQNLYIFSYYKLNALEFFAPVSLLAAAGLVWLLILNHNHRNTKLDVALDGIKLEDSTKTVIWAMLFAVVILSVFGVLSYLAVFAVTLAVTAVVNRKLFLKVDYLLLLTFVCFFIFIGNVSGIPEVNSYMRASLNSSASTFFRSILLSQFISNVPCSILLSRFTTHWRELLVGVNIGGMGTLIASLASLISYKLFTRENPGHSRSYILRFSSYNFLSLAVFTAVNYVFIVLR